MRARSFFTTAFGMGLVLVALQASPVSAASGNFSSSDGNPAVTATSTSGFTIHATQTGSGIMTGIYSTISASGGKAVLGRALAETGNASGVSGDSAGTSGSGVTGLATASSGPTMGIKGISWSSAGKGVFGEASASGGTTYGVYGLSASTSGRGVYGLAPAASGYTYGVFGESASTSGTGVYGYATATTGLADGVFGSTKSASGRGVVGRATAPSGATYGVNGFAASPSGTGVYGSGGGYGIYGLTSGLGNATYGVYSKTDLGAAGHLVAKNGNIAGSCTVLAGSTSQACAFPNAFASGTTPMVVAAPQGASPGSLWWIASPSTTGFTIKLAQAPAANKVFTYVVVGVVSSL